MHIKEMGFHERFINIQLNNKCWDLLRFPTNPGISLTRYQIISLVRRHNKWLLANTDEQIYIIRMADLINT